MNAKLIILGHHKKTILQIQLSKFRVGTPPCEILYRPLTLSTYMYWKHDFLAMYCHFSLSISVTEPERENGQ